ncbi:MAG: hypothetical protein V7761_11210 [Amylibacter sp.]
MKPVIFKTAADGIAREQALLAAGSPAVLLWEAEENGLVVPKAWAKRAGFDEASEYARQCGWPVYARSSGGGAVPQGTSTLNLAMVLPCPDGFMLEDGYRAICGIISEALTRFEIKTDIGACDGSFCDGNWNVLAGGQKLAGTAQRWRISSNEKIALIHAAILTDIPDQSVWDVLSRMQASVGQAYTQHKSTQSPQIQIKPDIHVSLNNLLSEKMRIQSVWGALARASEDRLSSLTGINKRAA